MNKHKQKIGHKISDGKYHEEDHVAFSRRRFLKSFGIIGGGSFLFQGLPFSTSAIAAWDPNVNLEDNDRILLLIRLKGGNDGLNTLVPLNQLSAYHSARPQLAYADSSLIHLDQKYAMSPHLSGLKDMWDNGILKFINGVGYPEQNYSHFRSSDIWDTASNSDDLLQSGWLGRLNDYHFQDFDKNPPNDPPSIQIGGSSGLLFSGEEQNKLGFEAFSGKQLEDIVIDGSVHSLNNLPDCKYGEQLKYARQLTNNTFRYIHRIKESSEISPPRPDFYSSSSKFAKTLMYISSFIRGGLKTKIYVVELDGFDTHTGQLNDHPKLLETLANDVKSFFNDLKDNIQYKNVLAATFSEFGRRIEENDSPGTDHGSASVMMLFGDGLKGSEVIGDYPSLTETDDYGNLNYNIDFRSVYKNLLENWLCVPKEDSDKLVEFDHNDDLLLGFECNSIATHTQTKNQLEFKHEARYCNFGPSLYYNTPKTETVMIELTDVTGKHYIIQSPTKVESGEYFIHINNSRFNSGNYFYIIRTSRRIFTGKIVII